MFKYIILQRVNEFLFYLREKGRVIFPVVFFLMPVCAILLKVLPATTCVGFW